MEQLTTFISAIVTGGGLIASTTTFLIGFIKNKKARKAAQQVIAIGNAVMPFIQEAETFTAYGGKEKKEYVMTKANQFAIDKGFKFDAKLVGDRIEELVGLTKSVNARTKDTATLRAPTPGTPFNGILNSFVS